MHDVDSTRSSTLAAAHAPPGSARPTPVAAVLALAVLGQLAGCARAQRVDEVPLEKFSCSDETAAATKRATRAAGTGDYAGAAAALEAATAYCSRMSQRELVTGAAEYRRRAALASRAGTEAGAARDLLVALVDTKAPVPPVHMDDPRVPELIATVRRLDPKAGAFFSPRPVQVVVNAEPGMSLDAADVSVAVAEPLRALGFAPGPALAADTLTLQVRQGAVMDASSLGDGLESCQLVVDATWVAPGGLVLAFAASDRGVSARTPSPQCLRERLDTVRRRFARQLLQRWAEVTSAP